MTDDERLENCVVVVDKYIKILHDAGIEAKNELDTGGTSLPHLLWMLYILRTNIGISSVYTYGKARGWLGFIQYGLIINGHATVEEERNFTRPLFA